MNSKLNNEFIEGELLEDEKMEMYLRLAGGWRPEIVAIFTQVVDGGIVRYKYIPAVQWIYEGCSLSIPLKEAYILQTTGTLEKSYM